MFPSRLAGEGSGPVVTRDDSVAMSAPGGAQNETCSVLDGERGGVAHARV